MTGGRAADIAVALGLTIAVFAHGFGLYPWYDDWMYLSEAGHALARGAPGDFIWSPFFPHWSPIAFAFEITSVGVAGWNNDALVRSSVAALVFGGLMLFATFARRLRLSRAATIAGMAALALHHTNAAAYYAFDCYDQIAADLVTWTILVLVVTAVREQGHVRRRRTTAIAAMLYVVALLVKEQALAAMAGLVVIYVFASVGDRGNVLQRRWLGTLMIIFLALSAGFAFARWRAGLPFATSGAYSFCARCVPGNVGLILSSIVVPVRTLDIFLALREAKPDPGVVLPVVVATLVVLALIVAGLASRWRAGDRRDVALYAALIVASSFPTALLGGVTELYAHTGLFWFAVLVAMAVDGWRVRLRDRSRHLTTYAGIAVVAYVAALAVGLRGNLVEMRASGERSRLWRERFHAALRGVPPGSLVSIPDLPMQKAAEDYGLYRVTAPGYLLAGTVGIEWELPAGIAVCRLPEDCPRPPDFVANIDADGRVGVVRLGQ